MTRVAARPLVAVCLLLTACKPAPEASPPIDPAQGGRGGAAGGRTGSGGSGATAGSGGGAGSASAGGSAGSSGGSAGGAGSGGSAATAGSSGSGGSSAGAGGSGAGGSGAGGSAGEVKDGPAVLETSTPAGDGGGGDMFGAEGDHLPGRPDLKICRKEWTPAQCCEFLCSCLQNICSDSAKGKPGIPTCMNWCPKLGDMARRCHVYHCFVSISPTGGIRDHDSHCGHAADQVAGGGCPAEVYAK
jgi:hypothetical protein